MRTGILAQQPDSYASALLTLLYDLHPKLPLPHDQLVEFASYQILHLACRVEDFRGAYEVRWEFDIRDRRIDQVLRALVGGDWWSWRCARNRVDQCRGRLMDFAEERMRKQALEGIGRAFMRVERIWLEKVMGMEWGELRREFGVGWELEGRDGDEEAQVVVIKRPRVKAG